MVTSEQTPEGECQETFLTFREWLAIVDSAEIGARRSYMRVLLRDVYVSRRPIPSKQLLLTHLADRGQLYVYAKE